jgi:MoaA/NifB/PqqE/SkfB family radical SAM enzyme
VSCQVDYTSVDQSLSNLSDKFDIVGVVECDNYSSSHTELYNKIQHFYKESYSNHERLIIVITKDFYKPNGEIGLILQSVQAMLNDIDISNYFVCLVTTNKNIKQEYQWVLDHVSTDKIPINVYCCDGDFDRIETNNSMSVYRKYQKLKNNNFEHLSDQQKQYLFESDSFCIIPWTSMLIEPSSRVRPCCESSQLIGDCASHTLQQLWNADSLKQLRLQMLAGQKPKSCNNCYVKETLGRDSLRRSMNRRLHNYAYKIDRTDTQGYLEDFSLNFLDARFNNLCNLSCRSCGPDASSSWHEPAVYLGKIEKSSKAIKIAGKNHMDIYQQIMPHIDTLQRVYFAGGEPLMIEQFYQLVEELDRQGRHDVELVYNINMTRSSLSGKSIFDIWENFKHISIGASLDGEYQRGEYLRCGQKWSDVIEFRKKMLEHRPDIDFYISATTSLINALHLPDFHRSWVEQGLINPEDFNIQLLFGPEYLRVDTAPEYLKQLIKQKYQQHLDWLQPQDQLGRATSGFESILHMIDCDQKFNSTEFWNNINALDQFYKKDLLTVFPELQNLPRN